MILILYALYRSYYLIVLNKLLQGYAEINHFADMGFSALCNEFFNEFCSSIILLIFFKSFVEVVHK